MSGCPLLHPGLTACTTTGQTRGMSGLGWVGIHSSILVQWLAPLLVGPGGISGLRQVGVHSSILVCRLASLLIGPGACLDLDEWVSTPLSRSDPCPGLVGPGGISGLRQVGVQSDGLHHYWSDQGHV